MPIYIAYTTYWNGVYTWHSIFRCQKGSEREKYIFEVFILLLGIIFQYKQKLCEEVCHAEGVWHLQANGSPLW